MSKFDLSENAYRNTEDEVAAIDEGANTEETTKEVTVVSLDEKETEKKQTIPPVIKPSFLVKVTEKTDRIGMTRGGSFSSLFWGIGLGIGGLFLFQWLKKEGYIKIGK